jgi:cytochrome c oxidase subunit 3
MIIGGSQWVNGHEWGAWCLLTGVVIWLATLAQWFGTAIGESVAASTPGRSMSRSAGA